MGPHWLAFSRSMSQLLVHVQNAFDAKTDEGSAALYFHYYGMSNDQRSDV